MPRGAELRFLIVLGIFLFGGFFACGLVWFVLASEHSAEASALAFLSTWWLFVGAYLAYAFAILISRPFLTKAHGSSTSKRVCPTDPSQERKR